MKYHIFESGSKGNCTLITSNEGKHLLIDMGISARKLRNKLSEVGNDPIRTEFSTWTEER